MKKSTNQQLFKLTPKYVFFWMLFLIGLSVNSQVVSSKTEVIGTVLDEKKNPLPNAIIVLKETNYGSTTDSNGNYSFSAPNGSYKMKITYLGYNIKEKKVKLEGGNLQEDFILDKSSETLNEIVVNGKNPDRIVLESNTATKSSMSLMNTPAPIVIVSKSLLDQQGNTTLQGAIRNISGVSQAGDNYNIGDNLVIRGLDANYTYDGMYAGGGLGNDYNPVRSQTNIDRIEVLKGPVTGLYGIGSAGGVINLVEKKPLFTEQGLAEFKVGQWNHFRAMVDYTAPISDKLAFRIVSASEGEEGYRDVSSERYESYLSFTFKSKIHDLTLSSAIIHDEVDIDAIGDPVRLISPDLLDDFDWTSLVNDTSVDSDTGEYLGLQLTDDQRKTLANSLRNNDGVNPYDIGDHTLVSSIAEPNKGKEYRVKLRYDIQPSENFTITNQLMYRTYSSDFTRQTGALNYVYYLTSGIINDDPKSPLVIDNVIYPLAARRQEYRHQEVQEKAFQYFGDFQYKWALDGIKGEHLLSANYENRSIDYIRWSAYDADGGGAIPYIYDITNPNAISGSFWDYDPVLKQEYDKTLSSSGIGFQEVLYLLEDKITARLGGAYSGIKQTYENIYADTPEANTDDSGFTYNLGLNYRPIDQVAFFGNYAQGRTAYSITGSITGDGDDRPDSESLSIDFGLRYKTKNNNLLASLVVFQTARNNLRYSNDEYDDNTSSSTYNVSVPQYFYDQENRTKGIELDVNYSLTKTVSFNANATFQDPKTLEGEDVTVEQSKGVPKAYARFWSEYKQFFRNSKNPFLFNLGLSYMSKRTIDGYDLTNAYVKSYFVVDAGVGYNLNNKWNFRLNIENALNADYYSKAMYSGALPGETRNFEFTAQYKF